jgi:ribonuclease P protein component
MTPPEGPASGQKGRGAVSQPAVFVCLKLRVRSDFLKIAQERRQAMPGFLLQARVRTPDEAGADVVRIGFTCSKKLGNAVARNRAKRRLREIARGVVPVAGQPGWDYVLVGRPGSTATRDFALMRADLVRALDQIHGRAP